MRGDIFLNARTVIKIITATAAIRAPQTNTGFIPDDPCSSKVGEGDRAGSIEGNGVVFERATTIGVAFPKGFALGLTVCLTMGFGVCVAEGQPQVLEVGQSGFRQNPV